MRRLPPCDPARGRAIRRNHIQHRTHHGSSNADFGYAEGYGPKDPPIDVSRPCPSRLAFAQSGVDG
jgi:hypothetical protein